MLSKHHRALQYVQMKAWPLSLTSNVGEYIVGLQCILTSNVGEGGVR